MSDPKAVWVCPWVSCPTPPRPALFGEWPVGVSWMHFARPHKNDRIFAVSFFFLFLMVADIGVVCRCTWGLRACGRGCLLYSVRKHRAESEGGRTLHAPRKCFIVLYHPFLCYVVLVPVFILLFLLFAFVAVLCRLLVMPSHYCFHCVTGFSTNVFVFISHFMKLTSTR